MIFFVQIVCFLLIKSVQLQNIKNITLMGFLPMTGDVWPGGRALLPAMEMAIRDVNARPDILPENYRLNCIWLDTKCDAGISTNAMYDLLYRPPVKHMIIGPACSTEAEVQAQAVHVWNISHLSYAATSPVLSDKQRFPRFFRISPPDTRYNLARIALIKHFNWTKVATINVALDMFSAITNDFVDKIKGTNISIISEEIFDHDPLTRVESLKKKDARIILSASYENSARLLICAAYKVGLYGAKIVWIFPGWYVENWWREGLDKVPCTREEMDKAADGHFLTGIFFKNPNDEESIAGIKVTEFEALLPLEPTYTPEAKQYEFITANMYDSIWGAALTMKCADSHMKLIGHAKSLHQFEYSDSDIGDIITECLSNLSYWGLSGLVMFDRAGERLKNIKLDQIRNLERVTVGTYIIEEEPWHFEWQAGGIVWRDGVAPRDSTQITYTETTIPNSLYIIMSCFSAAGIVLAVIFLVINVVYRNHVFVKMSSPNINNILLTGCILSYSTVFMYCCGCTKQQHAIYCKIRHFTFPTGFTMAFGALFSKTWRVYRIFFNKGLLRFKIKDVQLIAIVVVLVVILLITMVIWEIVDPLFIQVLYLDNQMYMSGVDAEVIPYMNECTSSYYSYLVWTISIAEGVLLAFGAFISFETRKVRIDGLNESRQIGFCLYNVIILSVVGLTLSVLLSHQLALVYGVVSGCIITGTTITQLLVFVPKIRCVLFPRASDSVVPQIVSATTVRIVNCVPPLEPRAASFPPSSSVKFWSN